MANTDEVRPLIVKKKKVVAGGGHHGGAWKVAYADFVTAMMAFFLLMWLLGATDEKQRKGLADYFNPTLTVNRTSSGGAGMLAGDTTFSEENSPGSAPEGVSPNSTRNDNSQSPGDEAALPDNQTGDPPNTDTGAESADSGPDEGEHANGNTGGEGLGAGGLEAGELEARIAEQDEQARLEAVSRRVAKAMHEAGDGALERHFFLRVTAEGLVIEIIDSDDTPLFASASAKPAPLLGLLMDVLVPVLSETTNAIAVVGHTDAAPFGSAEYSNWELSADRANAARRMLTARGLPEGRITRITGKAAVEPLVTDVTAPQNRRIAITLLRHSGTGPGR